MSLIVITGGMFAGKSTTLYRHIECAIIANQKTIVYKPIIDTRSGDDRVVTHSGLALKATILPIDPPADFSFEEADVYAFDEAQFFNPTWISKIDMLSFDKEVICACLNQDSNGVPFGIAPQLMALADDVVVVKAVCFDCKAKNAATKTFRTGTDKSVVYIGALAEYVALCKKCWNERTYKQYWPCCS